MDICHVGLGQESKTSPSNSGISLATFILFHQIPLYHENPPSLFTMLKSVGRFLLWQGIQKHIHHQLNCLQGAPCEHAPDGLL
jgi:hypothetical protein